MKNINILTLGKRLRKIRKLERLSLAEFDKKTGVSHSSLHKTENGLSEIKLIGLLKILDTYPQYVNYLLTGHLDHLDIQQIPGQDTSSPVLLKDLADKYLEHHKVEYPATAYSQGLTLKIIISFFSENKHMRTFSVADISSFKAERSKKVVVSTINRNLSVLSAMLNYYRDHLDEYWNPPKIKLLKGVQSVPPKFYTQEELNKIYQENDYVAHVWRFLANTGLRISEFYNLKWEDVYDDKIKIISSDKHRNKSRQHRTVPLNDGAKTTLRLFSKNTEYVADRFSSVDVYKKRFRRICNKIGLKNKAGIHCLRHTFASHLVQNNAPMRKIQKLMGHASVTTTESYAHLILDDLNKEVAKINL